jgi:hypothetical protein
MPRRIGHGDATALPPSADSLLGYHARWTSAKFGSRMAGSRPQNARAILLAAVANRGESVSEVGVAQISAFQLGLQEPFDLGLPILPLLEATREALTGFVPGRRSMSKARFWLAILFHRLAVLLKELSHH